MSEHVDRGISKLGMVENVGVAIDISLLSHASPEIQCISGLNAAICFWLSADVVNVDDATVELGMVEIWGLAVGISLIHVQKSNYAHLIRIWRFSSFFSGFPV